jgi:hypothetical protein
VLLSECKFRAFFSLRKLFEQKFEKKLIFFRTKLRRFSKPIQKQHVSFCNYFFRKIC